MVDEIESVSLDELNGTARGRRILSETPAAKKARERRAAIKAGTVTPKERGSRRAAKPRGGGRSRTPQTPKTLYPEIAAALSMGNMIIAFTPFASKYEPTGVIVQYEAAPGISFPMPEQRMTKLGDELDEMEIANLAAALDRQCQRSPRFKKYVEMVLNGVAGGGILTILGMIAARRASRHGILNPTLDGKLGAMMAGDVSAIAGFMSDAESGTIDETPNPETGERAPVPTPDLDFESL